MVPVYLRVSYEMSLDPIGPRFQQSRPLTAAGTVHRLLRRSVYREDILSVHRYAWDLIACGPLGNVLQVAGGAIGCRGGPMVHLVDKNYRKLPRGRCIQCLMEGAAIRRAVTEKHHGYLVIMKYPAICQCCAYRQIVPAAYNAVGTQHSDGKIRNVHGAASAVAKAGLLTVNLRHHPVNIRALGNAVSMPAVRGFDQIILPQGSADTGGNGLFPNVQMHKSGKLLVQIVPLHAFLKAADQLHRAVKRRSLFLGDLNFRHVQAFLSVLTGPFPLFSRHPVPTQAGRSRRTRC